VCDREVTLQVGAYRNMASIIMAMPHPMGVKCQLGSLASQIVRLIIRRPLVGLFIEVLLISIINNIYKVLL
jgi:hypothetical protein